MITFTSMKKAVFAVSAVAVVAAAGWSYQQSKQYDGLSELALANVEALATGEDGGYGPKECNLNIVNGTTYFVRDCSNCWYVPAAFFGGTYFCYSDWEL